MSDWQIGDKAVPVDSADDCPGCADNVDTEFENEFPFDGIVEVVGIDPPEFAGDTCGLQVAGDAGIWCSCGFRKIRPDEQEACEPEFITLLKRSKVTA